MYIYIQRERLKKLNNIKVLFKYDFEDSINLENLTCKIMDFFKEFDFAAYKNYLFKDI